ncbi:MAG: diguanylate cyclase [Candidatus Omnitrophica bacterium]|nr:diguanylate cyclase [Candidatus Omnitrophota bacterium]
MKEFFKTLSLAPQGIRYKLSIAFALMSIIPMLVCGYLMVHYIFPVVDNFWDVSLILVITMFLMLLGFYLAKKIIYPIVQIAAHAKIVAGGENLGKLLDVQAEDELGDLSGSINLLSKRLSENMSELRSYGDKIKQINMEINRKVLALSSLLQIGNLITTATNLEDILNLIVNKLSQLETSGPTFLMLVKEGQKELSLVAQANIDDTEAKALKVKIGEGLLGKILDNPQALVVDLQKKLKHPDENLQRLLPVRNKAVVPIISGGRVIGILGTGNDSEKFLFSDDEIELMGVFGKQVAVAIENDVLVTKTEKLQIRDELTGLYNQSFIHSRLDEEIKRAIAYQRPCSLLILECNNFEQYRDSLGEIAAERALKKIAHLLKETTTDIDKAGRFSDHQFALILPEKNKNQAQVVADNINKGLEQVKLSEEQKPSSTLTFIQGISATPVDGTTGPELIHQALEYVGQGKPKGA